MKKLLVIMMLVFGLAIPTMTYAAVTSAPIPHTTTIDAQGNLYIEWNAVPDAISYTCSYVNGAGYGYSIVNGTNDTHCGERMTTTNISNYTFYVSANFLTGPEQTTISGSSFTVLGSSGGGGGSGDTTPPAKPSGLQYYDGGNGSVALHWTIDPDAAYYAIFVNGQPVAQTSGDGYTLTGLTPGQNYSVEIMAVDGSGNESPHSDAISFTPTTGGGGPTPTPPPDGSSGGTGTSCDGCTMLKQMLACPEWDTYMGSLTNAIKDALPPPPDWPTIAKTFADATISALDQYMGSVPAAPTTDQIAGRINEPMPSVDTSYPDASGLKPSVPADFDQPQSFDISSGPQISIVDESEPFDIPVPMDNVPHDAPGVMVKPKDPRNSSNGIKQPDRHTLPQASAKVTSNPAPTTAPAPHSTGGAGAIPSKTMGPGATPRSGGGPGATPNKK